MKGIIVLALLLLLLATLGCVGGDIDEHGCNPVAGYTWCESKQECIRLWEEECEEGGEINGKG